MIDIIIASIIAFFAGFIIGSLLFAKRNNSELFIAINDFRKSLDEYKSQNLLNSREIREAIKDAAHLSKVLTTNQNLKGKFGEDCLEAILKVCYPNENINYIKQFCSTNEEGKEIKPDYLINLPNNKSILIDCKLNLEKYIDFKENQSISKKNDLIKDINSTINNLANKKYETAQGIYQPDFILMYIPLEPVITLIYTDSDFGSIIKNANDKNIIIVGNSSILTTVRLTNLLWAQHKQENNIKNIVSIAENIYNLIAIHSRTLYEIKNSFEENAKKFNKEYERMTSDNKLFKAIEELRSYGINISNKKVGKRNEDISINTDFLR